MRMVAEDEFAPVADIRGCADHNHERSRQLDALWQYDQYVANADGHPTLQTFWRELKTKYPKDVRRISRC